MNDNNYEQLSGLLPGFSPNDGLHDDTEKNPARLRFRPGNLVMFKSDQGWFEGEVVKVNQRLVCGPNSQYIAYIIWPHRDDVDGTEWVFEDTDNFIKPRMEDKTPDPSKFKPLLVVPDDPYHFLYDFSELADSKTEDGMEMADLFSALGSVANAKTGPDGRVSVKTKDGSSFSTCVMKIPEEPILGVEPFIAMMYSTNQLSIRKRVDTDTQGDLIALFRELDPKESLSSLEQNAKSSHSKMLLLADCLMIGINGFPRNPHRACNLYRAAAWGCTEEEEPSRIGLPNGIPEAMIASASLPISMLKQTLGYDHHEQCNYREWIEEGLKPQNMDALNEVLFWLTHALTLHGHVTSIHLMMAKSLVEMNVLNDARFVRNETLLNKCQKIIQANEYRKKEIEFKKMQERGFPRGDPPGNVIDMFQNHAQRIFSSLPFASEKVGSTIHIEFKQVPRPPFPMVVVSIILSKKKVQKIVKLPNYLQMTPFSKNAFQYVWLRTAFDIHLGRLGTNIRVKPKTFTVPDTHGNMAFASFLKDALLGSGTNVKIISHSDYVTVNQREQVTVGQLVMDIVNKYIDISGVLFDEDTDNNDIAERAQEDFFDRLVAQEVINDEESEDISLCLQRAKELKQRGNDQFQAENHSIALKCYSKALGYMRRLTKHDDTSYKLIGTLLSNRAVCFLHLLEKEGSDEFKKVLARNAVNDCTNALGSSWAKESLPRSILDKLKFRLDKASACYDSLASSAEDYSVRNLLFPPDTVEQEGSSTAPVVQSGAGADDESTQVNTTDSTHAPGQSYLVPKEKTLEQDHDALIEKGGAVFKHNLAKNAKDGCPICLRHFNGELASSYCIVLPCREHALCSNCTCSIKIHADEAKQCPQCPLCRYAFDPFFIEEIPKQLIEKDQEIANLVLKLPDMSLDEKIDVAERLLWTHRFEQSAVVDAIESLLDGQISGLFFRSEGELSHEEKCTIYNQARAPVKKLEQELGILLEEQRRAYDIEDLDKICHKLRKLRTDLFAARMNARDEIYRKVNTIGGMGAEQEGENGSLIKVDYHGLHVNEMRQKFRDHVMPILPAVKKVMIIVGRGSHSTGKESKLRKALFKFIAQYESKIYWQKVDKNPGALYVLWRDEA